MAQALNHEQSEQFADRRLGQALVVLLIIVIGTVVGLMIDAVLVDSQANALQADALRVASEVGDFAASIGRLPTSLDQVPVGIIPPSEVNISLVACDSLDTFNISLSGDQRNALCNDAAIAIVARSQAQVFFLDQIANPNIELVRIEIVNQP